MRQRHGACGARRRMRQAGAAEQEMTARQRYGVAASTAAQPARHGVLQHPGVQGSGAVNERGLGEKLFPHMLGRQQGASQEHGKASVPKRA